MQVMQTFHLQLSKYSRSLKLNYFSLNSGNILYGPTVVISMITYVKNQSKKSQQFYTNFVGFSHRCIIISITYN